MRLNALSAGVEAPTMCFSGVIHSIFHQACNVSLESDALLTLVSSEKGNLSQGIRLGTPPKFTFLNQLRVGQPFACRGGILRISGSELSVDLRTASLLAHRSQGIAGRSTSARHGSSVGGRLAGTGETSARERNIRNDRGHSCAKTESRDIARDKDTCRKGGPNRSGPDRCDTQLSG